MGGSALLFTFLITVPQPFLTMYHSLPRLFTLFLRNASGKKDALLVHGLGDGVTSRKGF